MTRPARHHQPPPATKVDRPDWGLREDKEKWRKKVDYLRFLLDSLRGEIDAARRHPLAVTLAEEMWWTTLTTVDSVEIALALDNAGLRLVKEPPK